VKKIHLKLTQSYYNVAHAAAIMKIFIHQTENR